jgi:hypothetical protein
VTRYRTSFETYEQAVVSFETYEQAVVEALFLGLMAPGEAEAAAAAKLVEELAVGLDEATLEQCKAAALERFEAEITRR